MDVNANLQSAPAYDYIVVGSGAGGGPLAGNLAVAGYRVLVLEAGRDGSDKVITQVPNLHAATSEDPELRWDYFVRHYTDDERHRADSKYHPQPEEAADPYYQADPERRQGIYYPRFSALGGCTTHHAMVTLAPHNRDWDRIAELTGDASWRGDHMRRYWERLEDYRFGPVAAGRRLVRAVLAMLSIDWNPGRRGHDGWLPIRNILPLYALLEFKFLRFSLGMAIQFVKGSAEGERDSRRLGTRFSRLRRVLADLVLRGLDPNDWQGIEAGHEMVALTPLSVHKGARHGPREYLNQVKAAYPDQLDIKTECLVCRVLFEGNRAIGVEYIEGADWYFAHPNADPAQPLPSPEHRQRVFVRHEVILATGVFNTPQLLMLSGIGPAEDLAVAGFQIGDAAAPPERQPIHILPGVGQNLQDRYEAVVVSQMTQDFGLLKEALLATHEDDPHFRQWRDQRKGIYTSNGFVIGLAKKSDPTLTEPDLYWFGLAGYFKGYEPKYSEQLLKNGQRNWFTWGILKAHSNNRYGYVKLRSADPRDVPEINFRSFDDDPHAEGWEDDLDALVEGVKFARQINRGAFIRGLLANEYLPGPDVQTDAQLRDWIKRESWGHHGSCTCPIGPPETGGVVDSRFRVHGAENLRVVDASVFPEIPGLFIAGAIYMISEKASEVILEDAERRP